MRPFLIRTLTYLKSQRRISVEAKSSDPAPAQAVRIKVTGVETEVLAIERPMSRRRLRLLKETIETMIAAAALKKIADICVSVTVFEVSLAVFDQLSTRRPVGSEKPSETGVSAQTLMLVVNGQRAYETPSALSFDRGNMLEVIERMSGRQLESLLEYRNFTVYNRSVNGKGRSYTKVKPAPAVSTIETSTDESRDRSRDRETATVNRISRPSRQRQIAFAVASRR
ncbi:MAG: hypothetical protein M1586_01375 [Patescibacteria group bacterium]|nr:hypothetical protein [Patescibacteria group bacterium]MCL5261937.1 hypothetical protein [Patescibacteria group bacterium]